MEQYVCSFRTFQSPGNNDNKDNKKSRTDLEKNRSKPVESDSGTNLGPPAAESVAPYKSVPYAYCC